jgi:hypothetical protein
MMGKRARKRRTWHAPAQTTVGEVMKMQGLFTNPFVEGVILVILGLACSVIGTIYKIDDVITAGPVIMGTGIGYFARSAVQANNIANKVDTTITPK